MQKFAGKVALVTGAGGGIGRAVACALAAEGASVIVADIVDAGRDTVALIEAAGGRAAFVRTDVQSSADTATMVRQAVTRFGRLDIAINNAGIDPEVAPEAEWDEATMARILGVNVQGVFLCLKHEIAQMLKQGGGAIVNLASAAGVVGVVNKPAYTASKHAVVGLTKASGLQYASRGIRINAVCPGAVDTQMLQDNLADGVDKALVGANHPIGRLASPEEIARAVLWLCSEDAGYVVGHALVVDGGLTVQ
ncbi:glucose 1-dehydrogenase [Haliea sp. E1-2-M8]|uniref:glucose 1-dehydrogenase n=1 Tax=Haliea sp. E1-2-M8 TaxID=3064706 RepID=UPI002727B32B|nr:glucose 1-dehydrogenase [Haliea sp. E1-2-M8]MDO8862961.1 glucose 1-dehydrogenase [Haliea sp. E1-2-M8]